MTRLTFVGDIALDKPLLHAAKTRGNGNYDFSDVFHTEEVFRDSDLVVGNLETCFGGGNRFNKKSYHYNSPDSFCAAIKEAGIDLVSTANNHCIDESIRGIQRTIKVLENYGIAHTGTFSQSTENRFIIKEINGVKIAFYSLTYSVNSCLEALQCTNLYQYINLTGFKSEKGSNAKLIWRHVVKPKLKQIVMKSLKRSTISAHTDSFRYENINSQWMQDIEKQIYKAKHQSDLLVILLHSGGQFNIEPGEYSKRIADVLFGLGANIIIGNHSHTVQRVENRDGKLVAYSLGGYCMSVSGEYLVHECLPEYSLALHVDIDEKTHKFCCSVDVLKGSEDANGYLQVKKATDHGANEILVRSNIISWKKEGENINEIRF